MVVSAATLRLIHQLRADLELMTDVQIRTLVKAWAQAWDDLAGTFDAAALEMASLPPAERARSVRLQRALRAAARTLDGLATGTARMVGSDVPALAVSVAAAEIAIIASQLPRSHRVVVRPASPDALAAMTRRVTEQITALTLPMSAEGTAAIRAALLRGVALGANPRATAADMLRRAEGAFNGGLSRALVIARTETLDAYRTASALTHEANDHVLAGWMWLADLGPRCCPACWGMHGSVHPLDEPGPLGHQQCLTAGAVVSGPRATASTTRRYRGDVIDIETDGGHRLTVTPNHPVLTTQGWVPASELREGHYLICAGPGERPSSGGRPHDHQVPALVEDVAQSVGGAAAMAPISVPTAAEDFHGDGAGGEIHVVRADGFLWDHMHVALGQPAGHLAFLRRGVRGQPSRAQFSGEGTVGSVLHGQWHSTSGLLCAEHERSTLLGSAPRGHQSVGGRGITSAYARSSQAVLDGASRDPVLLGERVAGLTGLISGDHLDSRDSALRQDRVAGPAASKRARFGWGSPQSALDEDSPQAGLASVVPSRDDLAPFTGQVVSDRVFNVRRRSFRGHVYNLQTITGWYVANGILVHNCRCVRTPVTRSWHELGFSGEEPPSVVPDAQQAFRALPEPAQRTVMGPARLDALNSGRIGWDDLPARRSTPGWRDSYTPAPVSDLLAT